MHQRISHRLFSKLFQRRNGERRRHQSVNVGSQIVAGFAEQCEGRMMLTALEPISAYEYDPNDPDFVPSSSDGRFAESSGEGDPQAFTFNDNSRWRTTVTDGSGLQQGDPTTLTWSLVRDGVNIPTGGEPASPNDLIGFLGNIHGVTTDDTNFEDEPWFPLFTSYLERFGEFSGLSYVYEPNDDGAAFCRIPWRIRSAWRYPDRRSLH